MTRRDLILGWLKEGIEAVDPERLTRDALAEEHDPATIFALGKAAPAMVRGAAEVLKSVRGLCITNHPAEVPDGIEIVIGDHPVPGSRSIEAGERALASSDQFDLALISGGGSAMCEVPRHGLTLDDLARINQELLSAGASIDEMNQVRAHLSQIKGGGLGSIPTLILSDVAGADPSVVASGPTIPTPAAPEAVLTTLDRLGISYDERVVAAVQNTPRRPPNPAARVIGDGRTAAVAIAEAASAPAGSRVADGWLTGPYDQALTHLIENAPAGITVAAGEPSVAATGSGRGGRNTHAALHAAQMIADTDWVFVALATDGADGSSDSAGAIVDGSTIDRGGDPTAALANSDSATYLRSTGDLIEWAPTGTNVADIWLIWKA